MIDFDTSAMRPGMHRDVSAGQGTLKKQVDTMLQVDVQSMIHSQISDRLSTNQLVTSKLVYNFYCLPALGEYPGKGIWLLYLHPDQV